MFVGKDTAVEAKKGIKVGAKSLQRSPFALDADAVVVASGGPSTPRVQSTPRVRVLTTTGIDIFSEHWCRICPETWQPKLSTIVQREHEYFEFEDQAAGSRRLKFLMSLVLASACVWRVWGGAQSQ